MLEIRDQDCSAPENKAAHKLTLRTCPVTLDSIPSLAATEIRLIRERFNMSRNVFAKKLRISPRTLERWEQGISRPNQQAAVLMLLVVRFGDMLDRIATLR
jgi:putative transcriptional regulator